MPDQKRQSSDLTADRHTMLEVFIGTAGEVENVLQEISQSLGSEIREKIETLFRNGYYEPNAALLKTFATTAVATGELLLDFSQPEQVFNAFETVNRELRERNLEVSDIHATLGMLLGETALDHLPPAIRAQIRVALDNELKKLHRLIEILRSSHLKLNKNAMVVGKSLNPADSQARQKELSKTIASLYQRNLELKEEVKQLKKVGEHIEKTLHAKQQREKAATKNDDKNTRPSPGHRPGQR